MKNHMKIEYLALHALTPYARNSRTHSTEQVEAIARSIREFGFTNPVLIDAGGGIIAGHGRVMAAQLLGMERVPCIRLAHLSEAQARALVIADNRLAENAGLDLDILRAEIEELEGLGLDQSLMGFDDGDLDALIEEMERSGDGIATPEASSDARESGQDEDTGETGAEDKPRAAPIVYPVIANLDRATYELLKQYKRDIGISDTTEAIKQIIHTIMEENT